MPERYVAVAEEPSYAPATPVVPNKFFDANFCETSLDPGLVFPVSIRGRSLLEHREGYLQEAVAVNMDVKPNNMIGWFLKWILGSVTSAQQGATVAYKHTFKVAETVRSFALGYNWDAIKEKRVPGCIMSGLSFSIARGATPLIADITAIGQTEKLENVQSPSGWSALAPFKPYQSKVELADSELANLVEGFIINIAPRVFGVGDIGVLGSRKLTRIELAERTITGSMDLPLLSGTLDIYQRFLKDTAAVAPGEPVVPFKLELLIDTGIVIADTYKYRLDFILPKCVITGAPVRIERQERKMFRVDFQCEQGDVGGNTTEIQVELTNADTGYPDAT